MINSLMRTLVPAIYLGLIHLGLSKDIPQDWVLNLISLVVLAAVYLLLRLLEQRWRVVGLLLGWIGAPSYDQPAHDAVDQAQTAARDELGSMVKALGEDIAERLAGTVNAIVASHTRAQTREITDKVSVNTAHAVTQELAKANRRAASRATTAAKKAPAKKAAPPKA